MHGYIYCLLSLLVCVSSAHSNKIKKRDILPADYDKDSAPVINGEPVIVNVSLNVFSLNPANSNGDLRSIEAVMWLTLYWTDYRLQHPTGVYQNRDNITLKAHWKNKLWTPGLWVESASTVNVLSTITPSLYFVVTNRTTVAMMTRLSMTLYCNMQFQKYPFDTQVCSIVFESLAETCDTIQLRWSYCNFVPTVAPEYTISLDRCDNVTHLYTNDNLGLASELVATYSLTRNYSKFLGKRYLPSFLIVVVAIIGFWIPSSVPPARVTLLAGAFVTLIAQQINEDLTVSYIYALEVWNLICILFVFAAFVELAIALAYPYHEKMFDTDGGHKQQISYLHAVSVTFAKFLWLKPYARHSKVDISARFLFAHVFAIGIALYAIFWYFL